MRKLICVVFVLLLFLVSVSAEEKKDKPYGECGIDNPQKGEEHARYIPTQEQRCLTKKGRIWGSTSKIYNCEHKGSLTSYGSGRTGSSADEFVWKPTEKTCKTGCASDGKRCKEDEEKCPAAIECKSGKIGRNKIAKLVWCDPETGKKIPVMNCQIKTCPKKPACDCISTCVCTNLGKLHNGACGMCPMGYVLDVTEDEKKICKPDPAILKK